MVNSEERMKVLKMVQDGRITADEASELLKSLEASAGGGRPGAAGGTVQGTPRFFRVVVTDTDTGKVRVNIRMPIGMLNAGIKMGMKFAPEIDGLDPATLASLVSSGEIGQILDVYDDDDGEHVEVFIE